MEKRGIITNFFITHFRINLRCFNATMPKHFANFLDGYSITKSNYCRKCMPSNVKGYVLIDVQMSAISLR